MVATSWNSKEIMEDPEMPVEQARQMIATGRRAYLGTIAARESDRFPFVSLVLPGLDMAGRPLLLLSDLSDHAKNLKRDPKASLLYDGTLSHADPLTGPRVTLIGTVVRADSTEDRRQYLQAQPAAEIYAGFGDFHFYRFEIAEALLVAGFGKIHRLSGHLLAQPGREESGC
jgi:putative heme iron utilization protein